jgi:hypothetical protein
MGYRIVYGKQEKKIISLRKVGLAVAAIVMSAMLLWPSSRNVIQEVILPGDADVTAAALQHLVAGLGDGQNLGEAVTAFCQEIIASDQ